MDDVTKKCPACFEIHADYTSVPDDDKIMCVKCGVKFSPSWFIHTKPSPMQLAIHRDNESGENDEVEKGCLISLLMVISIGFVVLLVALSLLGQAIDGLFEWGRDALDRLNPWNWGWNNGRGKP